MALSLDGMYRRFNNQFDTRETNRIWNPGGTALSATQAFRNGQNETVSDYGTPDYARRRYLGLTLGARKREGRFKAQASYTLSQLKGTEGSYGDNPAQDVYLYGYLPDDHRHEMKALVAVFGDQLAVDRHPLRTTARASPTTATFATRSPTPSRTTGLRWASTRAPTSTTPATTASFACPTCRASTCRCGSTCCR